MAARHRLEAQRARHGTREWVVKRRERTRHLIVRKSGLVDLTGDDRAVLYGAFLEIAAMLQSQNREQNMALWRSRGSRAFKSETNAVLEPNKSYSVSSLCFLSYPALLIVLAVRRGGP
jgi:conjugative transfer protein TraD